MDFAWRPDQLALHDELSEFGRDHLGHDMLRRDRDEVFDAAGWAKAASAGLTGLSIQAEFGGRGADPLTAAFALEGLGYGCRDNGWLMSLGAHLFGCAHLIAGGGSAAQKARFLPPLCAGTRIGALAVTEKQAGSDVSALKTTARRDGADYVLDGHKVMVTNAPIADIVVVLATVNQDRAGLGLACFVVERGALGLAFGENETKMGLRTAPAGSVVLQECRVAESQRLGAEGAGLAIFDAAMAWERGMILAPAVGTMRRLLEMCCARARDRRQFGGAIGGFQHVSGKLVDMQARLETSRALLYKAAWLKARGRPSDRESALAKLHISEAWVRCCEDALQIHGGHGYMAAAEVERELRDAIGSRLYSGTSEVLKAMLGRRLMVR